MSQTQILCRRKIIAIATVALVYENWKVKNSHFQHLKLNYLIFDGRGDGGSSWPFSITIKNWIPMRLGQTQRLKRWKQMVPSLIMLITINQTWHFRPPLQAVPLLCLLCQEAKGVSGIVTASNGWVICVSLRSSC